MSKSGPAALLKVALLLVALLCVVMAYVHRQREVEAQSTCTQPPLSIVGQSWPQGRQITVNIDPSFADWQYQAIRAGFVNWQSYNFSAEGGNCSLVTFVFTRNTYGGGGLFGTDRVEVVNESPPSNCADTQVFNNGFNSRLSGARMRMGNPSISNNAHNLTHTTAHEVGHTFGLGNCTVYCNAYSLMGAGANSCGGLANNGDLIYPSTCDNQQARQHYCPPPEPTPTPTPDCDYFAESPYHLGQIDCSVCTDGLDNDCDLYTDWQEDPDCWNCTPSPIVIDVAGDGLRFTSAEDGVLFDIDGNGVNERLSWIAPDSDDAWLALDHNDNGAVDSGRELFGNFTAQTPSAAPNGFLALAEFDKAEGGGNSDGVVDGADAVFSGLRLRRDANHDGMSQQDELRTLPELGLARVSLDYKESKRVDRYGNQFRYRAKVEGARGTRAGRWAWDVFLASRR